MNRDSVVAPQLSVSVPKFKNIKEFGMYARSALFHLRPTTTREMSTTLEQSLRPVEIAEGMPEIQGHEVPGPTIYTIG